MRFVPVSGSENQRQLIIAADLQLDNEILVTEDQRRVWLEERLVSASVLHGTDNSISSEALMIGLNASSTYGCHPGDFCLRTDVGASPGSIFQCLTNNGESASDWIQLIYNLQVPNNRIVGRTTAETGDPEFLTLTQVLDLVGSAANGDILYRTGGAWARLGIGTTNQILTVNSGLPSWENAPGGTGLTVISSATTYYVNTSTGNDSTGDGTSGTPWATVQKAFDEIKKVVVADGGSLTIDVAAGTYSGGTYNSINPLEISGAGSGSTTITEIIVSEGQVTIESFATERVEAFHAGFIYVSTGMAFTATAKNDHIAATYGGHVQINTNYAITGGGAARHYAAYFGGHIQCLINITVTITGTPVFAQAFARAQEQGGITFYGGSTSFSGTMGATTPRYSSVRGGQIFVGGGSSTFFPGTSSGASSSNGYYGNTA